MEVKFNKELNAKGLYAAQKYSQGETIFTLTGKIYDHPTRETIYVGNNTHIHDENGAFINHSFSPSMYVRLYELVAKVDLEVGDEITFDYNSSELSMANPFEVDGKMVCGNDLNKIGE